jgi:glycosyltransferase involved in cell wall biosynthesis
VKLAFITARYGGEITRGPEYACRLLAEHLAAARHSVDVITTCARDATTWGNVYPEGTDRVRGVVVRRFTAIAAENHLETGRLAERFFAGVPSHPDEVEWIRRTGPWSPAMMNFLGRQHRQYDALVFFSWRHVTTIQGLMVAPKRSVLVPWLQDDPALRFGIAQTTLASAAGVAYLSACEQRIRQLHTRGAVAREEVVGIGVQPPPQMAYPRIQQDPNDEPEPENPDDERSASQDEHYKPHLAVRGSLFRRRHRLDGRLVMYGGRIETRNGCEEMLEYFDSYATQAAADESLVMLGVKMMKVPEMASVRMAGVLPDRERLAAFEAADVTIAPSPDDLCAESVLESMAAGTPVLTNARNDAAVEHCRNSNAGLYYANRDEFVEAMRALMDDDALRDSLGRNGLEYARQHFGWDAVLARFERLVTSIRPR